MSIRQSETTFRGVVTHVTGHHQMRTAPGAAPPAASAARPVRTDAEILAAARGYGCCEFAGTGFVYKGTYLPSPEEFAAHGWDPPTYDAKIAEFKSNIDRSAR